jgi:hypothetical protein
MTRINETIIRNSIKKVLKEEFSSFQLQDALNNVEKMVKNYDSMDCNKHSNKEYVNVYCKHYEGASLENIRKIRDAIKDKLGSSIYNDFRDNSSWGE